MGKRFVSAWHRLERGERVRERHTPAMSVAVASRERASLGEAPLWDAVRRRLLYLDLVRPAIIVLEVAHGRERRHELPLPAPLGGLLQLQDGGFAVCCRTGIFRLCPDSLRVTGLLIAPHDSFAVAPPNDACVHPSGHVLIVTADAAESSQTGGLFVVSKGVIRPIAGGYVVGNGPAFSRDGRTVYVADSPSGIIYAYDWQEDGATVTRQRVFASLPRSDGFPDGLCVDADGGVWSARWGGRSVVRYSPDGQKVLRIEVPTSLVTSCAFGGHDLRTLYITSARAEDAEDSEPGGSLFSVDVEVAGLSQALGRL
jgi:D-xylonolactonase